MKIMIDAGHGFNTPGKQTPDGMKEYEFNRATALWLKKYLGLYKNVSVHFAHSDEYDVPLQQRTAHANSIGAHLYVSLHANAYGNGWSEPNGVETYIHTSRPAAAASLASIIQERLAKAAGLRNRGVKTANFQVLRQTKCTALLIECGFMTNRHEAGLLRDDSYRKLCAKEISKSIADYYSLSTI
ncbi:N-acetylmuramoyl-L-alanine amidase [Peribacillus sp. B-H-3]|uniref:N-acetylmuramoyl-L-alanine amidase n=1 Tax=Peribacillus sp. B-H-3 TaxID=3400420 RepID=UPI003B0296F3